MYPVVESVEPRMFGPSDMNAMSRLIVILSLNAADQRAAAAWKPAKASGSIVGE